MPIPDSVPITIVIGKICNGKNGKSRLIHQYVRLLNISYMNNFLGLLHLYTA